ncbi:MAG: hypothetical protein B7X79_17200 [Acidovorax sp. 17-64-282]|nr:MAG: hypothetical protein B7X79_17200 [Acidovorax sp. 17-64-282]
MLPRRLHLPVGVPVATYPPFARCFPNPDHHRLATRSFSCTAPYWKRTPSTPPFGRKWQRSVFVRGVLVGGCDDVRALIASGELAKLLAA